jgi:ABC-type bacteriocin/lantibiotic exporter with double-glycine peptidase domain
VAFVGRSGSGKSTLAALLLGLYRPTSGEIRYDGVPLDQLDLRSLRGQIGSVLQESYLFAGSIRSNIAFSDPGLPFERVVEAARLAAIGDEIERLAMGYEALVQEGGGTLSGGERQRLSIARAVASRPAILILDEATSHLDSATEDRVTAHLADLRSTRVLVAHRLSTIRHADQILVFEDGEVVERGRHDELIAADGLYRRMVRTQDGTVRRDDEFQTFGLTAADRG